MSIRRRMTLAVGGASAALLVVFAFIVYGLFERSLVRQLDDGLVARAHALANILEREAGGWEMELDEQMAPEYAAVEHPAAYFEIWLPQNRTLRSHSLRRDDELEPWAGPWSQPAFEDVTLPDGRPGRTCGIRFVARVDDEVPAAMVSELQQEVVLVVAADATSVRQTLVDFRGWLLVAGLVMVLAAAVIASFVVARGLRPLSAVGARIAKIDSRSLDTRIETAGLPVELHSPVEKLNELLASLQWAFERERRFTADVSHELRTPLAGLQMILDVAASKQRSAEDYRETVGEARGVVGQMTGLVENLLYLARLDAGRIECASASFSLRDLVDECFAPHAAQAEARGVSFENNVSKDATLVSDRNLLAIAVGNVLANAVDYTEPGGWIRVSSEPGMLLEVADSGPTLPEADVERVFDRMWRHDDARSDTGVHAGIGLALTRAVCEALGLHICAENTPSGHLAFRFTNDSSSPDMDTAKL